VAAKPSQKAPKEQKTTKGKVLPRIHCISCQRESSKALRATYFTKTTENHEQTTRKVVPSGACCSTSTSTTPSHEGHAQRMQGQQEADESTTQSKHSKFQMYMQEGHTEASGYRMSSADLLLLCSVVTDIVSQIALERSRYYPLFGSDAMQYQNRPRRRGAFVHHIHCRKLEKVSKR
jgi:hypothetical protein